MINWTNFLSSSFVLFQCCNCAKTAASHVPRRKTPTPSDMIDGKIWRAVFCIHHFVFFTFSPSYGIVQDNDAPKGPRKADMPKAPLAMQGSINNEETAKEMLLKTNEDGCTYYESPCRSVASVNCHKHKHVQTHQTTLTAQTVLTSMTTP